MATRPKGQAIAPPVRFIFFQFNVASARLKFLLNQSPSMHLCYPTNLPKLSETYDQSSGDKLLHHPANTFNDIIRPWRDHNITATLITDCCQWVETPQGIIPIYGARITSHLEPIHIPNSAWIELPSSFARPPIERQLIHWVYDYLLG